MQVLGNTGGIAHTNAYLVADEGTGEAVLFDAPNDTVAPLLDEAERRGWKLTGLWLTHGHFDHIADHTVVAQRFPDARVLIHRLDEPKLLRPNSSMFLLPFTITPRRADAYVEDGQKLRLGSLDVEVLHTPGHAPGHVMYHFPQQKLLVGGDLILMRSVGRTDLPDSDNAALMASLRKVMALPPDTQLLPGHGPPSTLGEEREENPYVQAALDGAEHPA
jgi:glyoxylase-like metal-dependent hydrolase (beta-lactamase superfamily II)